MEVLLIIILSFFALGYLLRLLSPYILKWYVRRMQKRFGFTEQGQQRRQEGEVTINKTSTANNKKKKTVAKDVGDYIDFEEVK